uniref:Cardiomyopathy associated 5 n=1 Tax=Monodelphis domestica TaxID=13616 RepID=A0A5F8HE83_MONDO
KCQTEEYVELIISTGEGPQEWNPEERRLTAGEQLTDQNEEDKTKQECIISDPSFSMVTVQREDSGITWETSSSRSSTPWASESSLTSDMYSLEGSTLSSPPGNISFILDEGKKVRKRTHKSSSKHGSPALRRKGGKKRHSLEGQADVPANTKDNALISDGKLPGTEQEKSSIGTYDKTRKKKTTSNTPPITGAIYKEHKPLVLRPVYIGTVQYKIKMFNSVKEEIIPLQFYGTLPKGYVIKEINYRKGKDASITLEPDLGNQDSSISSKANKSMTQIIESNKEKQLSPPWREKMSRESRPMPSFLRDVEQPKDIDSYSPLNAAAASGPKHTVPSYSSNEAVESQSLPSSLSTLPVEEAPMRKIQMDSPDAAAFELASPKMVKEELTPETQAEASSPLLSTSPSFVDEVGEEERESDLLATATTSISENLTSSKAEEEALELDSQVTAVSAPEPFGTNVENLGQSSLEKEELVSPTGEEETEETEPESSVSFSKPSAVGEIKEEGDGSLPVTSRPELEPSYVSEEEIIEIDYPESPSPSENAIPPHLVHEEEREENESDLPLLATSTSEHVALLEKERKEIGPISPDSDFASEFSGPSYSTHELEEKETKPVSPPDIMSTSESEILSEEEIVPYSPGFTSVAEHSMTSPTAEEESIEYKPPIHSAATSGPAIFSEEETLESERYTPDSTSASEYSIPPYAAQELQKEDTSQRSPLSPLAATDHMIMSEEEKDDIGPYSPDSAFVSEYSVSPRTVQESEKEEFEQDYPIHSTSPSEHTLTEEEHDETEPFSPDSASDISIPAYKTPEPEKETEPGSLLTSMSVSEYSIFSEAEKEEIEPKTQASTMSAPDHPTLSDRQKVQHSSIEPRSENLNLPSSTAGVEKEEVKPDAQGAATSVSEYLISSQKQKIEGPSQVRESEHSMPPSSTAGVEKEEVKPDAQGVATSVSEYLISSQKQKIEGPSQVLESEHSMPPSSTAGVEKEEVKPDAQGVATSVSEYLISSQKQKIEGPSQVRESEHSMPPSSTAGVEKEEVKPDAQGVATSVSEYLISSQKQKIEGPSQVLESEHSMPPSSTAGVEKEEVKPDAQGVATSVSEYLISSQKQKIEGPSQVRESEHSMPPSSTAGVEKEEVKPDAQGVATSVSEYLISSQKQKIEGPSQVLESEHSMPPSSTAGVEKEEVKPDAQGVATSVSEYLISSQKQKIEGPSQVLESEHSMPPSSTADEGKKEEISPHLSVPVAPVFKKADSSEKEKIGPVLPETSVSRPQESITSESTQKTKKELGPKPAHAQKGASEHLAFSKASKEEIMLNSQVVPSEYPVSSQHKEMESHSPRTPEYVTEPSVASGESGKKVGSDSVSIETPVPQQETSLKNKENLKDTPKAKYLAGFEVSQAETKGKVSQDKEQAAIPGSQHQVLSESEKEKTPHPPELKFSSLLEENKKEIVPDSSQATASEFRHPHLSKEIQSGSPLPETCVSDSVLSKERKGEVDSLSPPTEHLVLNKEEKEVGESGTSPIEKAASKPPIRSEVEVDKVDKEVEVDKEEKNFQASPHDRYSTEHSISSKERQEEEEPRSPVPEHSVLSKVGNDQGLPPLTVPATEHLTLSEKQTSESSPLASVTRSSVPPHMTIEGEKEDTKLPLLETTISASEHRVSSQAKGETKYPSHELETLVTEEVSMKSVTPAGERSRQEPATLMPEKGHLLTERPDGPSLRHTLEPEKTIMPPYALELSGSVSQNLVSECERENADQEKSLSPEIGSSGLERVKSEAKTREEGKQEHKDLSLSLSGPKVKEQHEVSAPSHVCQENLNQETKPFTTKVASGVSDESVASFVKKENPELQQDHFSLKELLQESRDLADSNKGEEQKAHSLTPAGNLVPQKSRDILTKMNEDIAQTHSSPVSENVSEPSKMKFSDLSEGLAKQKTTRYPDEVVNLPDLSTQDIAKSHSFEEAHLPLEESKSVVTMECRDVKEAKESLPLPKEHIWVPGEPSQELAGPKEERLLESGQPYSSATDGRLLGELTSAPTEKKQIYKYVQEESLYPAEEPVLSAQGPPTSPLSRPHDHKEKLITQTYSSEVKVAKEPKGAGQVENVSKPEAKVEQISSLVSSESGISENLGIEEDGQEEFIPTKVQMRISGDHRKEQVKPEIIPSPVKAISYLAEDSETALGDEKEDLGRTPHSFTEKKLLQESKADTSKVSKYADEAQQPETKKPLPEARISSQEKSKLSLIQPKEITAPLDSPEIINKVPEQADTAATGALTESKAKKGVSSFKSWMASLFFGASTPENDVDEKEAPETQPSPAADTAVLGDEAKTTVPAAPDDLNEAEEPASSPLSMSGLLIEKEHPAILIKASEERELKETPLSLPNQVGKEPSKLTPLRGEIVSQKSEPLPTHHLPESKLISVAESRTVVTESGKPRQSKEESIFLSATEETTPELSKPISGNLIEEHKTPGYRKEEMQSLSNRGMEMPSKEPASIKVTSAQGRTYLESESKADTSKVTQYADEAQQSETKKPLPEARISSQEKSQLSLIQPKEIAAPLDSPLLGKKLVSEEAESGAPIHFTGDNKVQKAEIYSPSVTSQLIEKSKSVLTYLDEQQKLSSPEKVDQVSWPPKPATSEFADESFKKDSAKLEPRTLTMEEPQGRLIKADGDRPEKEMTKTMSSTFYDDESKLRTVSSTDEENVPEQKPYCITEKDVLAEKPEMVAPLILRDANKISMAEEPRLHKAEHAKESVFQFCENKEDEGMLSKIPVGVSVGSEPPKSTAPATNENQIFSAERGMWEDSKPHPILGAREVSDEPGMILGSSVDESQPLSFAKADFFKDSQIASVGPTEGHKEKSCQSPLLGKEKVISERSEAITVSSEEEVEQHLPGETNQRTQTYLAGKASFASEESGFTFGISYDETKNLKNQTCSLAKAKSVTGESQMALSVAHPEIKGTKISVISESSPEVKRSQIPEVSTPELTGTGQAQQEKDRAPGSPILPTFVSKQISDSQIKPVEHLRVDKLYPSAVHDSDQRTFDKPSTKSEEIFSTVAEEPENVFVKNGAFAAPVVTSKPPGLTEDQKNAFSIISEGCEILNIHAPAFISSVDEEECEQMKDKLEYLEEKTSKSIQLFHDAREETTNQETVRNKSHVGHLEEDVSLVKGQMQEKPLPAEENISTDSDVAFSSHMTPSDVDYFEKYTLIDYNISPEPQKRESLPKQDIEGEPQKKVSEETVSFLESSEDRTLECEFELVKLDESFYGMEKGDEQVPHTQSQPSLLALQSATSETPRDIAREGESKSPGMPLFNAEEGVLSRTQLFPTEVKAINPELLEEPPALAFFYKDLYEEAVGDKKKEGEATSDGESLNSEASFPSRHSDAEEEAGMYFEKYILKDDILHEASGYQKDQDQPLEEIPVGKDDSCQLIAAEGEVWGRFGTISGEMGMKEEQKAMLNEGEFRNSMENSKDKELQGKTPITEEVQLASQKISYAVPFQDAHHILERVDESDGQGIEEENASAEASQHIPVEVSYPEEEFVSGATPVPESLQVEPQELVAPEMREARPCSSPVQDEYEFAELMNYEVVTQADLLSDDLLSESTPEDVLSQGKESFELVGENDEFAKDAEQRRSAPQKDLGSEVVEPEQLLAEMEDAQKEAKKSQIDTYCYTCKCPISAIDKIFGAHKDHEVAALDTAISVVKIQLGEFLENLKEKSLKIEAFVTEIESFFNTIEENCSKNEKRLEEQNEEMMKKVLAQYDEKAQSFEEVKKKKMEYLHEQMVNFLQSMDTAKETLETIVKEAEELDEAVLLTSFNEINDRLLSAMESTASLENIPTAFSLFEHYDDSSTRSDQTLKQVAVPQPPILEPQEPNSATSTTITVYWSVRKEDVIESFQVYCMEDPQEDSEANELVEEYRLTVKESYCLFEDLEPGRCYQVWVMAVNFTGCSLPSERATFRTAPSTPIIKAEDCTVCWNTATIRWSSANPGASDAYTLEYCRQHSPEGEGLRSYSGIKGFQLKVNLQPNDNYFFYAKAVNAFGTSEQSEAALISTRGTRFLLLRETAHPALQISSDGTVIRFTERRRLTETPSVLGEQLPACGQHYWETTVTECPAYRLGICSSSDMQASALGQGDTSWYMHCSEPQRYKFFSNGTVSNVHVTEHPVRVGILLDYSNQRLLFINAESGQLLFTIRHRFAGAVHPAFALEKPGQFTLHLGKEPPDFLRHK